MLAVESNLIRLIHKPVPKYKDKEYSANAL